MHYLMVFLGGGLGASLRYLFSRWNTTESFPLGTFLANVLGCLLMVLFTFWLTKRAHLNKEFSLLLLTGFCGGLTTFSTFTMENYLMFKKGLYAQACFYGVVSLGLGMLSMGLGFWILER